MIQLGPNHRRDNRFYLRHGKTGADTILPVASALEQALAGQIFGERL